MTRSPLGRQYRRVAAISAAILLTVSLQGCGADKPSAPAAPAAAAGDTTVEPSTDEVLKVERNAFPAYVKHKWDTTVVEQEPKRIVALGLRDHDMLISLGVTPIAIRNAFGVAHPYSDWPWVPDRISESDYEYLQAGLQEPKTGKIAPAVDGPIEANGAPEAAVTPHLHQVFDWEHIASLHPDLIVGTFSGITKEDYDKLVKIAPTITGVSADSRDYFSSWQEEMLALGKAVGRPKAAAKQIEDTEALFNEVREAHPEFKGARVAVVAPSGGGKVRVINPYAPMARFFTSFRMNFPSVVDSLMNGPKNIYGVEMDSGSLPLLGDVDVLVWIVGAEGNAQFDKIKNSTYYQQMPVVRRGGAIYLDGQTAEALYFSSPMSIPWAMEQLKPRLFKALEHKAQRDAEREAEANRAAERADENGDFTFEFGTPPPSPEPDEGDDGNGGPTASPTASPSGSPSPEEAQILEPGLSDYTRGSMP
jgi:iron complex transport system substrate-binding protein